MDLNYAPEDIAFRKQVRPWLEQNHRNLFEAGYLGMGWPEEYGGGGAWPVDAGELPLKDAVKEKWLYGNAARVFGIQ